MARYRYAYAVHRGRSLPVIQGVWRDSFAAAVADARRALTPELLVRAEVWRAHEQAGRTWVTKVRAVNREAADVQ